MNAQTQSSLAPEGAGTTQPQAQPPRLDFWIDTCRELAQMRLRSERVIQFYQLHGCRFLPPTSTQAESILAALDAAMPTWEQQHPELFYQALELNFPELVRRTRIGT